MDDKPWKIAKSDTTFEKPELFTGVEFALSHFNSGCFYNIRSKGSINVDHVELIRANPTLLVFRHETNRGRRNIILVPEDVCIDNIMFEEVEENV